MKKQLLSYSLIGGGKSLVISLLCILFATNLFAYDYSKTVDGVTLYFNELSTYEAEVAGASNTGITSVTIPQSVSFQGASGKKTNHNVVSIGKSAFGSYKKLATVKFEYPLLIKKIGESAFGGCASLASIDLSSCTELEYVGDFAFDGCASQALLSLPQPSKLSFIGESAFRDCSLSSTTLQIKTDQHVSIGHWAFFNTNLETLDVEAKSFWCDIIIEEYIEGLNKLVDDNFHSVIIKAQDKIDYVNGQNELTNLSLSGDTVSVEGDRRKTSKYSYLKTLTLEVNKYLEIGPGCFRETDDLRKINITARCPLDISSSFYSCRRIETINLNLYAEPHIASTAFPVADGFTDDNIVPTKLILETHNYQMNSSNTAEWIANSGITSVTLKGDVNLGLGAFSNCQKVTNISIDDKATTSLYMDGSAFTGCNALTNIYANCYDYGSSGLGVYRKKSDGTYELAAVSPAASSERFNITTTYGGALVTSIGDNAFYEYGGTVHVPYSVTSIGKLDRPKVTMWWFDGGISPAVNSSTSFRNSILLVPSLAEYNKAPFSAADKIVSTYSNNDEDVNNDGKVNATDAMQIYNYILSH